MSLQQVEKPALEPVSLDEVKSYMRLDGEHDDLLVIALIETARQMVETYTGRSLITQSWMYTIPASTALQFSDPHYFSGSVIRGERGVELPKSPFIDLITAPLLIQGKKETALESYKLDTAGRTARIHFHQLSLHSVNHGATIVVTYRSGYGDQRHDVPAPLRQAIMMAVADLYDRPTIANKNGFQAMVLSSDIISLIRPYKMMRLS